MKEFDERQTIERLKSYRLGYIVIFAVLMIILILDFEGIRFSLVDTIFIASSISIAVCLIRMFIKGAYIPVADEGKYRFMIIQAITDFILGIMFLISFARSIRNSPQFIQDGLVQVDLHYAAIAIVFVSLGIMSIFSAYRSKQEERRVEE